MKLNDVRRTLFLVTAVLVFAAAALGQQSIVKGQPIKGLLSSGGLAALSHRPSAIHPFAAITGDGGDDALIPPYVPLDVPAGIDPTAGSGEAPGSHDHDGQRDMRGGNRFVNDPCLDPPPPDRRRTVQSETSLAVLNGKNIVVGYNDSFGFYNNTQGLSGFAYSDNGGNRFIDGGGLPPLVPSGAPAGTPGSDAYFGDPVVVVHEESETFYYASIYQDAAGNASVSVNRGHFQDAAPQGVESQSNTRCLNHPELQGIPDPPNHVKERIIWKPPVEAVQANNADFLDKEWLYVNQGSGELYLTYTRFGPDGSTPLELVRSKDGGRTWEGPFVIVPNLNDTFNQATQTTVTATGRVIVTYIARTFAANGFGPESDDRIEVALSDNDGTTFSTPIVVQHVNPQGEPNGYNRGRKSILNGPYIAPETDGTNVYITYFNGKTPLQTAPGVFFTGPFAKQADIMLATSQDDGLTWVPVKVNDDDGTTSHVFPNTQVNKHGWVYVSWLDRRNDPNNVLTDTWAAVSHDEGASFGDNRVQSDVSTSWFVRADARPNFGDYNSSALLKDNQFVITWADGRFPPGTFVPATCTGGPPCAPRLSATPDVLFTIANGLGGGEGNQK